MSDSKLKEQISIYKEQLNEPCKIKNCCNLECEHVHLCIFLGFCNYIFSRWHRDQEEPSKSCAYQMWTWFPLFICEFSSYDAFPSILYIHSSYKTQIGLLRSDPSLSTRQQRISGCCHHVIHFFPSELNRIIHNLLIDPKYKRVNLQSKKLYPLLMKHPGYMYCFYYLGFGCTSDRISYCRHRIN